MHPLGNKEALLPVKKKRYESFLCGYLEEPFFTEIVHAIAPKELITLFHFILFYLFYTYVFFFLQ